MENAKEDEKSGNQNGNRTIVSSCNLNDIEDVREKYGDQPFEMTGFRQNDHEDENGLRHWKETRPVYQLTSQDGEEKVKLTGGVVYAVIKCYDDTGRGFPARYKLAQKLTAEEYQQAEQAWEHSMQRGMLRKKLFHR